MAVKVKMDVEPLSYRARLQLLMTGVVQRDEGAFRELIGLMGPVIFAISQRLVPEPHKASEVTQEVLFEIWHKADTFDADLGLVDSWIRTIASRRADDRAVSEERAARHERQYVAQRFTREYDQTSEAALDAVEHHQLRATLAFLSPTQREAITLAFYDGLTYEQVAAHQSVPLPTAKSRIRDAIIVLRRELTAPSPSTPSPSAPEPGWHTRRRQRAEKEVL